MDLALIEIAVIIAVVIAIINRVKAELKSADKIIPTYWFTVMAFGIGAVIYIIALFAPAIVTTILFIGLAASGIYDIFKK